jgi:hypothetical protein
MLFGVWDVTSLVFLGSVNAATNLFGDIMEVKNAGKKAKDVDWTPFYYGMIVGSYNWVIIYTNIFVDNSPNADVPFFVWIILIEYTILFCTFPYTMYVQYSQKGKFNNDLYPDLPNGGYLQGERRYGTLSLVAKTLLVWTVISGGMQPTAANTYQ